jgi:putative endonuclease
MTTDTTATKPAHLTTGERGEALAARYLEKQGLIVLSKNWRCPAGELDLVLTDGSTLIICEVKTRTTDNYGTPAEAVDDAKVARIRRLAHRWRTEHQVAHVKTRYDLVAILWPAGEIPQISHRKGVL